MLRGSNDCRVVMVNGDDDDGAMLRAVTIEVITPANRDDLGVSSNFMSDELLM